MDKQLNLSYLPSGTPHRMTLNPLLWVFLGLIMSFAAPGTLLAEKGDSNLEKICLEQMGGEIQVNCRAHVNSIDISSGSATNFAIANATITNLNVTGGIRGRVIQSSASLIVAPFSTTSGTAQQTNLFVSFACSSTANLVRITAWGVLEDSDANASNENVYLYSDSNQLVFSTILTTSGANQIRIPWSITYLHAPASTSAKVYNIRIASIGGNTVRLGVNLGGEHQYMLVEEIQQ